jgi:hypothetical protein
MQDGISEHCCFIEVDCGTESQTILAEKAICYRAHYRTGGFAVSRGGHQEQFEEYPFRLLAIFQTAERRNNVAELLLALNPPVKTMTWLATMPEILLNPLGAIWVWPADFQNVVADGRFALPKTRELGKYRRRIQRDATVETVITKHRLL